MIDAITYLTLRAPLPCGCSITQSVSAVGSPKVEDFMEWATPILAHWYDTRINKEQRHRCELVSSENPNGFAPRT